MRKILSGMILFIIFSLSGHVYAATNLSIRIEQPKTPTNQSTFSINFTALDVLNRSITVKCFKQGPGEGSATQFGSDIILSAGGNTGNCQVTNSQINSDGTYAFSVKATAGADTATDSTNVVYNTSGPGDPRDYAKSKIGNCTYNIHFKTAADGGKTVKVEIYRSENTSFNADSGTRVGTVNSGSDEAHDFGNDVPNCDKTYYYAIRSFDSAGNGSAVVGDNVTVTHLTTITPTPGQSQGAIPVANGQSQVLGTQSGSTSNSGQTLGEASPSSTPKEEVKPEEAAVGDQGASKGLFSGLSKKWLLGGGIIVVIASYLYARSKKKAQ